MKAADQAAPAGRLPVALVLGRAVVETEQCIAVDARSTGRDQARVDEEFVPAERAVAALLKRDAVGECLIGDGVVQVVSYAAIPGHVETSWPALAARHVRLLTAGCVEIIQARARVLAQSGNVGVWLRRCGTRRLYLHIWLLWWSRSGESEVFGWSALGGVRSLFQLAGQLG